MKKGFVLQQLAEKIKAHFAIPENREAFTSAANQTRKFYTSSLEMERACGRIKIYYEALNNLN